LSHVAWYRFNGPSSLSCRIPYKNSRLHSRWARGDRFVVVFITTEDDGDNSFSWRQFTLSIAPRLNNSLTYCALRTVTTTSPNPPPPARATASPPVPFRSTDAMAAAMVDTEDRSYVLSLCSESFSLKSRVGPTRFRRLLNRGAACPNCVPLDDTCSVRDDYTQRDGGRGPIGHRRASSRARTIGAGRHGGEFGARASIRNA